MAVKNKTYWFEKLKADVQSRLPTVVFRMWDPLTTWLEATGKRLAEVSADLAQRTNDRYIDTAKGDALVRILDGNEGVPKLEATGSDDGTITMARNSLAVGSTVVPIGAIKLSPAPDPANPTAPRPVFTNLAAITVDNSALAWTVAFKADTGSTGIATNLPAGTALQIVSQAGLFDTATVATDFTNARDIESEDDYRRRGKLAIRSRSKGTEDALAFAAYTAGAAYVFVDEDFTDGAPATIYACDAAGALGTPLHNAIVLNVWGNGLPRTDPDCILPARVKGIYVDVAACTVHTFNYTLELELETWVIDDPGQGLTYLTDLRADLTTALAAYTVDLNDPAFANDKTWRVNRVRDIVMGFKRRGVVDIVDGSMLPAANVTLAIQEVALMGTVTWL